MIPRLQGLDERERDPLRRHWLLCALCVALGACTPPLSKRASIHLVDRHASASALPKENAPVAAAPLEQWRAIAGIDELRFDDGVLSGKTSSAFPVLELTLSGNEADHRRLQSVQVRLRVSAPSELGLDVVSAAGGGDRSESQSSPTLASETSHAYRIELDRPVPLSTIRRVLLRPTKLPESEFAVEAIGFTFHEERLPATAWQGMWEVYRESIVTRASDSVSFDLDLPERPWLDLALGITDEGEATFRVEIEAADAKIARQILLERTLTRPNQWVPSPVDLDRFAGQTVQLFLVLESERPEMTGFWGTAAIRSRRAARTAPDEPPQGMIFIVADTLRADHLSAWGYERTTAPFLMDAASRGALFRNAVAQATWTKVSVPSIVTSLYPTTHGVSEVEDRLPDEATTMAEIFRDAGYATLGLTSIPLVGQFSNLQQGYEELHEYGSLTRSSNAKTAREYVDRLLPWLELHRDVPFFVFLHIADPHGPYQAYEPYDTQWGAPGDAETYARQKRDVQPFIEDSILSQSSMPRRAELEAAAVAPEEFLRYETDAYDGSIRAMDVELSRIFEQLRQLKLEHRTLVVFTSDHGTEFLDHDWHFHGHTLYGELSRVPLFFWGPSFVPPGTVLEETVQSIDIMPTVLELSRLPIPSAAQGVSLWPLFEPAGRDLWTERPAISEKPLMRGKHSVVERNYQSLSIIDGRWKLIRNEPAPSHRRQFELYDHVSDPLDLVDVASVHPDEVERLAAALERWERSALASRLGKDSETGAELEPAELERLRSLGYLGR